MDPFGRVAATETCRSILM